MTGEVFGAGQQVRAVNPAVATLKPTNGGDSDEVGKVRIFAVKLVKASKARRAGNAGCPGCEGLERCSRCRGTEIETFWAKGAAAN